jgi:hypothetical protein
MARFVHKTPFIQIRVGKEAIMHLHRKYIKVAILMIWVALNIAAAINNETSAVLNTLFGTFYYLYVAYSI